MSLHGVISALMCHYVVLCQHQHITVVSYQHKYVTMKCHDNIMNVSE